MGKPLLDNGKDSVVKISTAFSGGCYRNFNILVTKKYLVTNSSFHYCTDFELLSPKHKFFEFVTKKLLTDQLPDSEIKKLQMLLYVNDIVCLHLKVPQLMLN